MTYRSCVFFLGLLVAWAALCVLPIQGGRITLIGNGIKAAASGVDVAGATFLMNDLILTKGVVFAFSAYFRADNLVRFQIWRPTTNRSLTDFTLVHELRIIPSVINSREDIYMESLLTVRCPFVQQGDRLGIYMEEVPGSVAYKFDASTPMAFGHTVSNLSMPTAINESVTFDTLTFPYDFSMSAYIDTKFLDGRDYNKVTGCPKGLLIPYYGSDKQNATTTVGPIIGQAGATGPEGPMGAMGPAGPAGSKGLMGATGPVGPRGEPGPLADSQGATGFTGPEGGIGATGPQGDMGLPGVMGPPGVTGQKGLDGANGLMGAKGLQGKVGPIGPAGPPGPLATQIPNLAAAVITESVWTDPMVVMVLAVWIAILSVILLIIAIIACCCYCKDRKCCNRTAYHNSKSVFDPTAKNDFQYVVGGTDILNGLPLMPSEAKPEWMNSMREDTFKDYCIDTIDRAPSKRKQAVSSSTLNTTALTQDTSADLTDITIAAHDANDNSRYQSTQNLT